MKSFHLSVWLLALCMCCLPVSPALSADKAVTSVNLPALVTRAALEARLKEVGAATSLDEETRATLVETLNKTLGNLEAIKTSKATTESYVQARKTAPEQAAAIRKQLEEDDRDDADVSVEATADSPFDLIEAELLQEKANLAAVQAKLSDLQAQLDTSNSRPSVVQQQLLQAKQDKEGLEAKLKLQDTAGKASDAGEVNRWSLTTRIAALRSEISMLDQELLSMPMRVGLLEAQRDRAARSVKRVAMRVKILEQLSSEQGHVEVEQARQEAAAAVSESAGKHPLVQELAEKNSELSSELANIAASHRKGSASDESIDKEAVRIEDYFRAAQARLAIAGLSEILGEVLREQRQTLPNMRKLRKRISDVEDENAQAALRQMRHAQEHKGLRDMDDYIQASTAELEAAEAAEIDADIRQLAIARKQLLGKALDLDKSYSRSLEELATSYQRLLKTTLD